MNHPDPTTEQPVKDKKIKIVKMTPKQIQKAEEQSKKYLTEQENAVKELNTFIDEGLTPLEVVKALRTYKRLLLRNNKAVKKNYDSKKEIVKSSLQKAKDKIKEMKDTIIKEALEEAKEVYKNTIMKTKDNIKPLNKKD